MNNLQLEMEIEDLKKEVKRLNELVKILVKFADTQSRLNRMLSDDIKKLES